jgi:hypothetical protein
MLPLMHMNWAINRRLVYGFSPVLAFYLSMLVVAQCDVEMMPRPFALLFQSITGLVTLIITFQGLTLDVEGFVLSLPVGRAQIVRAKYLTCLLGLLAGVALPMATSWIAHFLAPNHVPAPSQEALRIVAMATLFYALGIFLFLPFVHHFGPSKGFMLFALAAILIPAGALAWKGLDGAEALLTFMHSVLAHPPLALGISAGALVFGLGSLALSTWSYRRRAF